MRVVAEQEVFQKFAEEFGCSEISDAELLGRAYFRGSPRDEDPRYMPGLPDADVRLLSFEYCYDLPQDEEDMKCMFNNHHHHHGVAFLFSDGTIRGVGRNCFSELAEHSGRNLGLLKSFIRDTRRRRISLLSLEDVKNNLIEIQERVSSKEMQDWVSLHDHVNDSLKRKAKEFYKFCLEISSNHGRLAESRRVDTDTKTQTVVKFSDFRGWRFFRNIWSARVRCSHLCADLNDQLTVIRRGTDGVSVKNLEEIVKTSKIIINSFEELNERISFLKVILSKDVMIEYVDSWKSRAPHGECLIIEDQSLKSSDFEKIIDLQ